MQHGFQYFAASSPELPAIVDARGRTWARSELAALVNRLSRAMRFAGLTSDDVVAVLAPNCPEYLAALLATGQTGLGFVAVNWHLAEADICHVLDTSGARLILLHESLGTLAQSLVRALALRSSRITCVAIGELPGMASLATFLEGHSAAQLQDPVFGRVLMFTSATTGRPKGIVRTLADPATALERSIGTFERMGTGLESRNVHLCASTLYHSAPLEFCRIALHMGHLVVLMDPWEPELTLKLIHRHRVSSSFMTPTMFVRLLKLSSATRSLYEVSSLRWINHAGAPCPVEIKQRMIQWWGPIIWEGYGASEGNGTMLSSAEWLQHPGSVGKPLAGSEVRILDENGCDVPTGQTGLIYLTHFNGGRFEYMGDPEKTARCYQGNYFTVGDLGYVDAEGYLYMCGRQDDLIITAGAHVYPAEIERALVLHPEVADCAVFGAPDTLLGQIIVALVQPMDWSRATPALSAELLIFLLERCGRTQLPRKIAYTSALARDPNGKLYRRRLRDAYVSGELL